MNTFISYYDMCAACVSMIFFLLAFYGSENIFIKARTRDVREILNINVLRYEKKIRIKLLGKFIISIILLYISLNRIDNDCKFISKTDMYAWLVLMSWWIVISFIDYQTSSPEND